MQMTSVYNDRLCHLLTLLLLAVALSLLIVGVALHNLFQVNAADITQGPATQLQGSLTSGAFSGCFAFSGVYNATSFSVNHCYSISSSCAITVHVQTVAGTFSETDTLPYCPQFNAFRAFAIIGIILLGPALLLAFLSLRLYTERAALQWAAVGLLVGAIISIVISWGCVANLVTKVDPNGVVQRGPAFAVCVSAWVLMLLGLILFIVCKRLDAAGYSKDAPSFRKQMDSTDSAGTTDAADTTGGAAATEMTHRGKEEENAA